MNAFFHKLTSSLCGFVLLGSFTPTHQQIADKYTPFFSKQVVVNVVEKVGYANGLTNCDKPLDERVLGCTYFDWTGEPYAIDILADAAWVQFFENTLIHESYHFLWKSRNEIAAANYANQMTGWRNSLQ